MADNRTLAERILITPHGDNPRANSPQTWEYDPKNRCLTLPRGYRRITPLSSNTNLMILLQPESVKFYNAEIYGVTENNMLVWEVMPSRKSPLEGTIPFQKEIPSRNYAEQGNKLRDKIDNLLERFGDIHPITKAGIITGIVIGVASLGYTVPFISKLLE